MSLDSLLATTMQTVLAVEMFKGSASNREKKQIALETLFRLTNSTTSATGQSPAYLEHIRKYGPVMIDTVVEALNAAGVFPNHDPAEDAPPAPEAVEAKQIIDAEDATLKHDMAVRRARGERIPGEENGEDKVPERKQRKGQKQPEQQPQ